jgi:hypothetical protein
MDDYIEELEAAIIDLLANAYKEDVQYFSGCSKERCKEIIELCDRVKLNYFERHNSL